MRVRARLASAAVVAVLLKSIGALAAEPPPVTVEPLGLTADKEYFRYRVHVNTDKPIEQVDLAVTYTAEGKKHTETFIWQNIVKSKRQPIEKGKTYEADGYLAPNTTAVESKLLRVVYKDMTTWAPAK